DVVPGHVGPAASYASRLGERVSHRGEPPVGGMVDLAVMDDAHSARDGGQDGPAEADEQLRGLGRRNEAAVYRELRPCSSTGTRSIEWEVAARSVPWLGTRSAGLFRTSSRPVSG